MRHTRVWRDEHAFFRFVFRSAFPPRRVRRDLLDVRDVNVLVGEVVAGEVDERGFDSLDREVDVAERSRLRYERRVPLPARNLPLSRAEDCRFPGLDDVH
jgi:hypothetical protein